jgi:hypothetical protein
LFVLLRGDNWFERFHTARVNNGSPKCPRALPLLHLKADIILHDRKVSDVPIVLQKSATMGL